MKTLDKLGAARLHLVRLAPYFNTGVQSMIPYEMKGLGTFGITDKMVLLYDPEVVEQWSVPCISGVLLHEYFHPTRAHGPRCKAQGADPRLWNIAADAEINDDILAAGFELPTGCITPKSIGQPAGKLAEEYYHALRQQAQPQQGDGEGDGESEGEGQEGDGKGGGSSKTDGMGNEPGAGKGWCGSGAGRPLPNEPQPGQGAGAKDEKGNEKGAMPEGRSEAEINRVRKQVAEQIRAAAEKGRGSIPAGWVRWADEQLHPPKVPWKQKLARQARQAMEYVRGMVDYTYSRPARRQASIGWGAGRPILPSLHAPIPRVAIGVDTSGSMGTAELSQALRETNGVIKAVGGHVDFLSCDASVHAVTRVRTWKEAAANLKGGGGTDFRPIFEAVQRMTPKPDLFIFITDGMGPAPEVAPKEFKTIWLLVSGNSAPVTWGEQIVMAD